VLITCGGVSAGLYDFVPKILRELGVREVFHKVSIKPGKPLWFGYADRPKRTFVFGVPGNPVSTAVVFEMLVRPALRKLSGETDVEETRFEGIASEEIKKKQGITHFVRANVE